MTNTQQYHGLWTYQDVALYLGISWRTVRKWASERKLPVVKVGNRNRFSPDAIEKWAAKRSQRASERA